MWIEIHPGEFGFCTRVQFDEGGPLATAWFGEYRSVRLNEVSTSWLRKRLKKTALPAPKE